MRNKILCLTAVLVGSLLVVLALVGLGGRYFQQSRIDRTLVTDQLKAMMPERSAGVPEERADNTMPVWETGGIDFIGLLEVPDRGIERPVGALWDEAERSGCPTRYMGSVYDGSLILGGPYAGGGFDFIVALDAGEQIIFVDLTGREFRFTVAKISHADNARTETLCAGDDDLTLFVKKDGVFLIVHCTA